MRWEKIKRSGISDRADGGEQGEKRDEHKQKECIEGIFLFPGNAFIEECAMVIEPLHTNLALVAMSHNFCAICMA